jgi:signal transduction histidine kinase
MDAAAVARARGVVADWRAVDGTLALGLAVLAQVQLPSDASMWLRAAMLVTTGSLAWRRRASLVVAVAVAFSVGVMGFDADPPSVFGEYLAVMLAAFTVAEQCRWPAASAGLLVLVCGIIAHDWQSPQFGGLAGFVSDSAIPVVIWLVGRAVFAQRSRVDRSRALIRQLEAEREQLAGAAVAQERAHLARELHDVVTHSLSVIVIQAQGAQRLLGGSNPSVGEALQVMEGAGRSTLAEMRRLLGLLREDEELPHSRQPGLADLSDLLDHVRSAGLPVNVTVTGNPGALDAGTDLSAYRVVQEALTNCLKYARPATATLSISWHPEHLELLITDTGDHRPATTPDGRGLLGMRERVAAHGGHLQAGPRPGGGFQVQCRLRLDQPT